MVGCRGAPCPALPCKQGPGGGGEAGCGTPWCYLRNAGITKLILSHEDGQRCEPFRFDISLTVGHQPSIHKTRRLTAEVIGNRVSNPRQLADPSAYKAGQRLTTGLKAGHPRLPHRWNIINKRRSMPHPRSPLPLVCCRSRPLVTGTKIA